VPHFQKGEPAEQAEADQGVLMAQNNSLVYYTIEVPAGCNYLTMYIMTGATWRPFGALIGPQPSNCLGCPWHSLPSPEPCAAIPWGRRTSKGATRVPGPRLANVHV